MERVVLDVPTLWADHHVLNAREALVGLEGVADMYASSAWKQILITYDEAQIDVADIESTLAEAGYPVDEGEVPIVVQPTDIRRDPQWDVLGLRMSKTNIVDLEMSGEFRRY